MWRITAASPPTSIRPLNTNLNLLAVAYQCLSWLQVCCSDTEHGTLLIHHSSVTHPSPIDMPRHFSFFFYSVSLNSTFPPPIKLH